MVPKYGRAVDYLLAEERRPLPPDGWLPSQKRDWRAFYDLIRRQLSDCIWSPTADDRDHYDSVLRADFDAMPIIRDRLNVAHGQRNLELSYLLEDAPEPFAHLQRWAYARFQAGFAGGYMASNPGSVLSQAPGLAIAEGKRAKILEDLDKGAYEKVRFIFKLKADLNRSRPFQMAESFDGSRAFSMRASNTAWSASLPAGHSLEAALAATTAYVHHKRQLQDEQVQLCKWAARAGDLRVWAGLHYPTDILGSLYLALLVVPKVFVGRRAQDAAKCINLIIGASMTLQVSREMVSRHSTPARHPFAKILQLIDEANQPLRS